jgi:hypothetical protein
LPAIACGHSETIERESQARIRCRLLRPESAKRKTSGTQRFRGVELVAGGRKVQVCAPVTVMLPVVGRVGVAAVAE